MSTAIRVEKNREYVVRFLYKTLTEYVYPPEFMQQKNELSQSLREISFFNFWGMLELSKELELVTEDEHKFLNKVMDVDDVDDELFHTLFLNMFADILAEDDEL